MPETESPLGDREERRDSFEEDFDQRQGEWTKDFSVAQRELFFGDLQHSINELSKSIRIYEERIARERDDPLVFSSEHKATEYIYRVLWRRREAYQAALSSGLTEEYRARFQEEQDPTTEAGQLVQLFKETRALSRKLYESLMRLPFTERKKKIEQMRAVFHMNSFEKYPYADWLLLRKGDPEKLKQELLEIKTELEKYVS